MDTTGRIKTRRLEANMCAADNSRLPQGPHELRCAAHQLPLDRVRHGAARQEEPQYPESERYVARSSFGDCTSLTLPSQALSQHRYGTRRAQLLPVCSQLPTTLMSSSTTGKIQTPWRALISSGWTVFEVSLLLELSSAALTRCHRYRKGTRG